MSTDPFDPEYSMEGKFQVSIDDSIGLIAIIPGEDLSIDDVNEFREGFLYESGCKLILWDLRGADLSIISGKDAPLFANVDKKRVRSGNRLAFVVPRPVDYGITRMIGTRMEIAGSDATIGQFYEMTDALDWLKESV